MIEAGRLNERVILSRREETNPDAPNDYGNTVAEWVDQGEVWAQFVHLRGGETVIAGRLQGRHTMVMRVRASPLTRSVTAEWKVTDAGTGAEYAVRDVTPLPDRSGLDLLVEGGVAV